MTGLITSIDGEDCLVGARCETCGTHVFPAQSSCPKCGAAMVDTALPATGTVWSATVQRIEPKPPYIGPEVFEPFAVAYVDLGPVRVESRLDGKPCDEWRIGDAVRLTPGDPDDQGAVWTYRFTPDTRGSTPGDSTPGDSTSGEGASR